jgi:hypothetical protein
VRVLVAAEGDRGSVARWNSMKRLWGMRKTVKIALIGMITAATILIGLPASPASAAPDPSGLVTLTQTFRPAINEGVVTGSLACPAGYRLVGSGGGSDFIGALVPMLPHFGGATISVDTVLGDSALLTIICAPADQFADVKVTQRDVVQAPQVTAMHPI